MFYEGVRVRVCGRCSGVLVGHPQLKLIVQRREVEIPREGGLNSTQGSERKNGCPACEAAMRKRRYRNSITVDQCPTCRSVWLDRGELEDLQLLAEMAADEKSASTRGASPASKRDAGKKRASTDAPAPAQSPIYNSAPPPRRPSSAPSAASAAADVSLAGLAGTAGHAFAESNVSPTRATQTTCPKCATVQPVSEECVKCGVIFAKVTAREARERGRRKESAQRVDAVFGKAQGLAIREYTGLESLGHSMDRLMQGKLDVSFGDRYDIRDHTGRMVAHAREAVGRSGSGWNVGVPIEVIDTQENLLVTLRAAFKHFSTRLEVEDAMGVRQGAVQTGFSLVNRRVEVLNPRDRILLEVVSPIFRPSTFKVRRSGRDAGRITKESAGLFQEWHSDADNFGVRFPRGASTREKILLLAATLLINAAYFENPD